MSDCPLQHSHFDYDPNIAGSSSILRCKGCGGIWPDVLPDPGGAAIMHVAAQHQDIQELLRAEIARLLDRLQRAEAVVEAANKYLEGDCTQAFLADALAAWEEGKA